MARSDVERIVQRRLHNLRLSGAPFDAPQEVVRWLGAVRSQDHGPAKWSIAERAVGVADADLDRAFDDGVVLRTHVLRPTWHFVLPEDINPAVATRPTLSWMSGCRGRGACPARTGCVS